MWTELVARYGDRIEMIEVDRDSRDGRAFAESHGIYYQPGFVALDAEGMVVYEGLGPYDGEGVTELVASLLGE